jgi:AraC-like DNA-binding protein
MSAFFESRLSHSPYVEIIWRGHVEQDYRPVCPADAHWNLLFLKHNGKIRVTAEGAINQTVTKDQKQGTEFLVIKFKLGVYMPQLPAGKLVNVDALLPDASSQSFWLQGAAWQIPDFDNVEEFVQRLVREGHLVQESTVSDALRQEAADIELSSRTVRRRFLWTTGLTPKTIQQIERAKQAAALLSQGVTILDTVYELGYADQPHLTRSLRRFYGQTPAQIASTSP